MENSTILPPRIRDWLNARGITDEVIARRELSYDGRIVIPVFNTEGDFIFNKYRRDPEETDGPKYTYDKGAVSTLYAIDNIVPGVIICEGELDVLALESRGFPAVSSTGGAGTFRPEWAEHFSKVEDIYMVFDNDKAGNEGRMRVARILPRAKNVPLPANIGEHGDITDYFVKLGKTPENLRNIMRSSVPLELKEEPEKKKTRTKAEAKNLDAAKRVPLGDFLRFDIHDVAICPFHSETTPSFKWYREKNRFYCFGCGVWGDVVDFIMKRDSISMKDAIKKLSS